MKLFNVSVIEDCEPDNILVVANSSDEAEEKVLNMDCWDCLLLCIATEVDIVDGYRIVLEKV